MFFNHHPYSLDAIGNLDSIKRITRKKIGALHLENLMTKEMVFTYCGDLDLESVKEKILTLAPDLISKSRKKKVVKNKIKPLYKQRKVIEFDREQTHIMIGKPAFKIDNDEDLMLKMFTTYLSGQSSELFVEVRDKQGLCYSCQPLHFTALEAGYWGIYIGAGHDKSDKATKAIMKIIKKFQSKGISKIEFNRIKKMIKGQSSIGVQTNDDYANFYSIGVLHDLGLDFQHRSFESIQKITHSHL